MPRTSSSKTPSKHKRASPRTPAGAAKKRTAAKHKALRAAKVDPVLTQELKDAPVRTAMPAVQTLPFVPAVELLALMSREQIRRMPVCNDRKEMVGIVALADLAEHDPEKKEVTEALADICEPSGLHCQAPVFA